MLVLPFLLLLLLLVLATGDSGPFKMQTQGERRGDYALRRGSLPEVGACHGKFLKPGGGGEQELNNDNSELWTSRRQEKIREGGTVVIPQQGPSQTPIPGPAPSQAYLERQRAR